MTKNGFKNIFTKCNSLLIMIGVTAKITKKVTIVDQIWLANSIQITLFFN